MQAIGGFFYCAMRRPTLLIIPCCLFIRPESIMSTQAAIFALSADATANAISGIVGGKVVIPYTDSRGSNLIVQQTLALLLTQVSKSLVASNTRFGTIEARIQALSTQMSALSSQVQATADKTAALGNQLSLMSTQTNVLAGQVQVNVDKTAALSEGVDARFIGLQDGLDTLGKTIEVKVQGLSQEASALSGSIDSRIQALLDNMDLLEQNTDAQLLNIKNDVQHVGGQVSSSANDIRDIYGTIGSIKEELQSAAARAAAEFGAVKENGERTAAEVQRILVDAEGTSKEVSTLWEDLQNARSEVQGINDALQSALSGVRDSIQSVAGDTAALLQSRAALESAQAETQKYVERVKDMHETDSRNALKRIGDLETNVLAVLTSLKAATTDVPLPTLLTEQVSRLRSDLTNVLLYARSVKNLHIYDITTIKSMVF